MGGHIPFRKIDIWLQGYRSLWLSTTRPDGRPHCVPVWYVWLPEEPAVYIATHYTAVKAHNLQSQPAVVLCAGNADDTIILEGTTRLVGEGEEQELANRMWMEKYVDPHSGAQATIGHPDDRIYHVAIHKIMTWEYGIIATRTDWHFN
jgi:nitroimidazol reductase NimA-like FMN-containing flavoprotein (pyridoxamine 5'-phosphate oxidase superfamily)